jgi:FAD/FMN-containing dehydrogenase
MSLSLFQDFQTSSVSSALLRSTQWQANKRKEVSKKEMDDLGLFASILGHIGDGNFHESIMYNGKDPKERAAVEKCVHDMVDRALEMDGTCTGEHGIGLGKKESLQKELGIADHLQSFFHSPLLTYR